MPRQGRAATDATEFPDVRLQYRHEERILSIPSDADIKTFAETLGNIAEHVDTYTVILGVILRSTNVRNSFEVFDPLKRLACQVLGRDIKLLLSSEWDFVPFTYPMTLDVVPDLIVIGTPATESGNALIMPVAGHEIGHSAWRQMDILSKITNLLQISLDNLSSTEADSEYIRVRCSQYLVRKTEELFCDIIGLHLFEESYVYAYHYLLSPGNENYCEGYVNDELRIKLLECACQQYQITCEASFFDGWATCEIPSEENQVLALADRLIEQNAEALVREFKRALDAAGVPRPRQHEITSVEAALSVPVPYSGSATLAEIVIAGWRHVLWDQNPDLSRASELAADIGALNELLLKSVEVSEYNGKVSGV